MHRIIFCYIWCKYLSPVFCLLANPVNDLLELFDFYITKSISLLQCDLATAIHQLSKIWTKRVWQQAYLNILIKSSWRDPDRFLPWPRPYVFQRQDKQRGWWKLLGLYKNTCHRVTSRGTITSLLYIQPHCHVHASRAFKSTCIQVNFRGNERTLM